MISDGVPKRWIVGIAERSFEQSVFVDLGHPLGVSVPQQIHFRRLGEKRTDDHEAFAVLRVLMRTQDGERIPVLRPEDAGHIV